MAEGGKKIEVVSECYFIMPTGKKTSMPRSVRLLGTAQHHAKDRELSCAITMEL